MIKESKRFYTVLLAVIVSLSIANFNGRAVAESEKGDDPTLGKFRPNATSGTQNWPQFHNTATHKGVQDAPATLMPMEIKWDMAYDDVDSDTQSSPIIYNGILYVGGNTLDSSIGKYASEIHAIDAITGALKWSYLTTLGDVVIDETPAAYIGSDSKTVICFAGHSRSYNASIAPTQSYIYCIKDLGAQVELLWKTPFPVLGESVNSSITISKDLVLVITTQGKITQSGPYTLRAYRKTDGVLLWSKPVQTRAIVASNYDEYAPNEVLKEKLYLAGENLYCLNAQGTVIWQRAINSTGEIGYSVPAYAAGKIFAASPDGNLYAFNATTGTPPFATYLGNKIFSSPAVFQDKSSLRVAVINNDGRLFVVDGNSGQVIWSFLDQGVLPLPATIKVTSSPSIDKDGKVFAVLPRASGNALFGISNVISGSPQVVFLSTNLLPSIAPSLLVTNPIIWYGSVFLRADGHVYRMDNTNSPIKYLEITINTGNRIESKSNNTVFQNENSALVGTFQSGTNYYISQFLSKAAFSAIPANADIIAAYYDPGAYNKTNDKNTPFSVYRMDLTWNPATVTWNNKGPYDIAHPYEVKAINILGDKYEADVTALVREWYYGTKPNYGMLLKKTVDNSPAGVVNYTLYETDNSPVAERPRFKIWYQ